MGNGFEVDRRASFQVVSQTREPRMDPGALDWAQQLVDRHRDDPESVEPIVDDIIGDRARATDPQLLADEARNRTDDLEARTRDLPPEIRRLLLESLNIADRPAPPTVLSEVMRISGIRLAQDDTCPKCKGSGRYVGGHFTEEHPGMCYTCRGTGRISNPKTAQLGPPANSNLESIRTADARPGEIEWKIAQMLNRAQEREDTTLIRDIVRFCHDQMGMRPELGPDGRWWIEPAHLRTAQRREDPIRFNDREEPLGGIYAFTCPVTGQSIRMTSQEFDKISRDAEVPNSPYDEDPEYLNTMISTEVDCPLCGTTHLQDDFKFTPFDRNASSDSNFVRTSGGDAYSRMHQHRDEARERGRHEALELIPEIVGADEPTRRRLLESALDRYSRISEDPTSELIADIRAYCDDNWIDPGQVLGGMGRGASSNSGRFVRVGQGNDDEYPPSWGYCDMCGNRSPEIYGGMHPGSGDGPDNFTYMCERCIQDLKDRRRGVGHGDTDTMAKWLNDEQNLARKMAKKYGTTEEEEAKNSEIPDLIRLIEGWGYHPILEGGVWRVERPNDRRASSNPGRFIRLAIDIDPDEFEAEALRGHESPPSPRSGGPESVGPMDDPASARSQGDQAVFQDDDHLILRGQDGLELFYRTDPSQMQIRYRGIPYEYGRDIHDVRELADIMLDGASPTPEFERLADELENGNMGEPQGGSPGGGSPIPGVPMRDWFDSIDRRNAPIDRALDLHRQEQLGTADPYEVGRLREEHPELDEFPRNLELGHTMRMRDRGAGPNPGGTIRTAQSSFGSLDPNEQRWQEAQRQERIRRQFTSPEIQGIMSPRIQRTPDQQRQYEAQVREYVRQNSDPDMYMNILRAGGGYWREILDRGTLRDMANLRAGEGYGREILDRGTLRDMANYAHQRIQEGTLSDPIRNRTIMDSAWDNPIYRYLNPGGYISRITTPRGQDRNYQASDSNPRFVRIARPDR